MPVTGRNRHETARGLLAVYFATKLNKENCHCFQVMHLSLLEANAEKEKII